MRIRPADLPFAGGLTEHLADEILWGEHLFEI